MQQGFCLLGMIVAQSPQARALRRYSSAAYIYTDPAGFSIRKLVPRNVEEESRGASHGTNCGIAA